MCIYDVNRLWELDQCDLSADAGLSVEDRYVVSFWDKYSRFVDGHWQVPIPWKQNDFILPTNYNQAKARLLSLRSSLERKSQFHQYDLEVKKLLDCKYAEYAPDDITHSKTWYIPHHSVPKKKNKLRLVFDCACRYKGVSLNSEVLQGPDYINKLHFVLLRFRQHEYALTADIESMYNQITVYVRDRDALR